MEIFTVDLMFSWITGEKTAAYGDRSEVDQYCLTGLTILEESFLFCNKVQFKMFYQSVKNSCPPGENINPGPGCSKVNSG